MRNPTPSFSLRMAILSSIEYADGNTIRERIKNIAKRTFYDEITKHHYQFTWRTISTWLYRYKKYGVAILDDKTRSDKNSHRKIQANELAELIKEVLPLIHKNKVGRSLKMSIYRLLIRNNLVKKTQLSQTNFYRMIRKHDLLDETISNKLRLSFAMQFANELWQADTMYGPSIKQSDGSWKKTFFIAFIDDASRLITHGEFFYRDNTENMIDAFKSALYKRGLPQRLYFDNGSNYTSKEIAQACLRLNIVLSHAPVRDGAAKGKIERFFRGFRDRFLTLENDFKSLDELNKKTSDWIENEYNTKHHSGIQMIPLDRFNMDLSKIKFLSDDEFSEEIFFAEEERKVSKTNIFSINNRKFECPVDLRNKRISVRYDRARCNRFIVYFNNKRMGDASKLNLYQNSKTKRNTSQNNNTYQGEPS